MLGHILLSATHRGSIFSTQNAAYALCNGQILNRSTYPDLSALWPVGAYGSTLTQIVLPNLSDGYYLRGHGFNNNFDPNISLRTSPSGSLPVAPSGIGTFQTGAMATHIHASGTQSAAIFGQGGGDGNPTYPVTGSQNSAAPSSISGAVVGPAAANSLDLNHMKFYPYLKIS